MLLKESKERKEERKSCHSPKGFNPILPAADSRVAATTTTTCCYSRNIRSIHTLNFPFFLFVWNYWLRFSFRSLCSRSKSGE